LRSAATQADRKSRMSPLALRNFAKVGNSVGKNLCDINSSSGFCYCLLDFSLGSSCSIPGCGRCSRNFLSPTKLLGSCQSSQKLSQLRDTATMMYLEVVQKNMGKPGSTRKSFLIRLSKLRVARTTPASGTCFATRWRPAIRSRRTWRREMPLPFQQYSRSYLSSN
jgi:hypothetical protein